MRSKILSALACLLLLTSCNNNLLLDPEQLLRAPTLNKQQTEVYAALEATLDISDIVRRPPQRGEYRSSFVFYDMTGDGRDEAIVFFSYQSDLSTIRTTILQQEEDGTWEAVEDFPMASGQVDFVQFAHMLSEQSACMIVGWQGAGAQSGQGSGSFLGVYSFTGDDGFRTEVSRQKYVNYTVQDFDGDGLEEIVTLEQEEQSQALRVSLLRSVGRHIDVISSIPLCQEADYPLHMVTGALWDGRGAVYVDEIRFDNRVATEIIAVEQEELVILAGGNTASSGEAEIPAWENYLATFRDKQVVSRDYDGDGVVEIPSPAALPGNLYEGEANPLMLTRLMHLTPEGFAFVQNAVINETERYLVYLPERWLGWVSVMRNEDDSEWRFYLLDPDPEVSDPSIELLRVIAYNEGGNTTPPSGSVQLESRGIRRYAGYIPLTTSDTPSITEDELKKMFFLLN